MSDDLKKIIPRWEWRYFTEDPGDLSKIFGDLEPVAVQKSREVYLLSEIPDLNIKYRFEQIDIKKLIDTSQEGYEQWKPVFKSDFPLKGPELDKFMGLLGIDLSSDLSFDRVEELGAQLGLSIIKIDKYRKKYVVEGVKCESGEIQVDSKKLYTIAIEDKDPAKVSSILNRLGVESTKNINYPLALQKLVTT